MNRVLLKVRLKEKILDFKRDYIDDFKYRSETSRFVVQAEDSESGYPIYNPIYSLEGYYNTITLESIIRKVCFLNRSTTNEEQKMVFLEWKNTLIESKAEIINTLTHFENMTSLFEREHILEALELGVDWINEENSILEKGAKDSETFFLSNQIPKIAEQLNNNLEWDNKTEISELIYVLFHSKRIKINGKPIEQKQLTEIFNKLFNTDIKTPVDLLNKSVKTFKRGEDGNTFINELNTIFNTYIDKIRDKE